MLSSWWSWHFSTLLTPCFQACRPLSLYSLLFAVSWLMMPAVLAAEPYSLRQIQAERIELSKISSSDRANSLKEFEQRLLAAAGDPNRLAALYLLKASLFMHNGLPAIEDNLAKALPLIDEKSQPELYLFALVLKSYGLYTYQNQEIEAVTLLEQVQQHPALENDTFIQVQALSNLMEVYYELKQYDKISKPLFQLARTLNSKEIEPYDQDFFNDLESELATHSAQIGDVDQAIALNTNLLTRVQRKDQKENVAIVYCNMANMYFLPLSEQIQYAKASLAAHRNVACSDFMEKIVLLSEVQQGHLANISRLSQFNPIQQMPGLNERSAYYAGLAFVHLNDWSAVQEMASRITSEQNWMREDLLRKIYQQQGDYQKALAANQKYYALRAQKDADARALMLSSYQTRLELAQEDTKAAEQAKQAEQLAAAEQKAAARLQLIFTVMAAGLLLTLILAMYLYRSRQLQQQLQQLSDTDPLTGLLNRRAFLRQAEQLKQLAQRQHFPLSVALIDLDFFKKINDQHGHQVGDAVLRAFADAAKATLRQTDIVGRFGGEEFILVTTQQDSAAVAALLQRLQQSFVQLCQQDKHIRFTVSFSAGIAKIIEPQAVLNQNIEEAIRQADEQLYRAKANGRQQACTAALCVSLVTA